MCFVAASDVWWATVEHEMQRRARSPPVTWSSLDTHKQAERRYELALEEERRQRLSEARATPLRFKKVVSIADHGATGDGRHDDSRALLYAVGNASQGSVVYLPGRYLFGPVTLTGLRHMDLRIDGTVLMASQLFFERKAVRPNATSGSPEQRRMLYAFLTVENSHDVTITGRGTVDGRGMSWWQARKLDPTLRAPVMLLVRNCTRIRVSHLALLRSPFYHVAIVSSRRVLLHRLEISAPVGSANTDGVDVLQSRDVAVYDCWISTGDDNVAIKEGSSRVVVRGGVFFRGHGLSVGSLGENRTRAAVSHLSLEDVTFVKTHTAARIKTWQGGTGSVAHVAFTNLTVAAVRTPIVVDQFYCPSSQHPERCANNSDAVKLVDVSISNFRGYQISGIAASLHCSQAQPCHLDIRDVQLDATPGCGNITRCFNVVLKTPGGLCARGTDMHGYRLDLPSPNQTQSCYNRGAIKQAVQRQQGRLVENDF